MNTLTVLARARTVESYKAELGIWQAMRLGKHYPPEVTFCLIAFVLERLRDERVKAEWNTTFRAVNRKMTAFKRARGLPRDYEYPLSRTPKAYRVLQTEWDEIFDRLTSEVFREHKEPEMADLYLNDREEFYRRFQVGRARLRGGASAVFATPETL